MEDRIGGKRKKEQIEKRGTQDHVFEEKYGQDKYTTN